MMKKAKVIIILGALLLVLQAASIIFDIAQGGLKFMPGFDGNAMMYNVSYLSVGIVGALLIVWGIIIGRRKED